MERNTSRPGSKVDAKTLMDRKLNGHLEKLEAPTEEVDLGNFETIESLLGNQMEEIYMQLQLHYATAIRLLAHRDTTARKYQENENLRSQVEALKTRDPRERDLKNMKLMNTQIKLYKDKYLDRDRVARAIELENFELREQLSAMQQVGNAYALTGGQVSPSNRTHVLFPPDVTSPTSPTGKPKMLYGGSPNHAPTTTPLDRLERAQLKLESWASNHRKRDLTGLVDVSELPNMELPGEIATRGSYGPQPKDRDEEVPEEPEKPEEQDEDEEVFYIRNAMGRVEDEETSGPIYYIKRIRDMFKSWFFQGDRDMQDTYWSSGICQYIARSSTFEHATMAMIAANAVWLGIDVTYNTEILLINSAPVFIIMENIFCSYFFCEIVVRFGAFRKKCNVFRDFWFVFDFALVLAMVVDTWALLIIMAALDTNVYVINSSFLRMLRIIRISRLARVARIMRSVPEVMILFQGMGVASRSVICALSLLVTLVYVFSLAFTQLLRDTPAGDFYFPSLTHGMFALFFHGCLGEQLPDMASGIFDEGIDVGICLMIFIFLGPFTVMNMIVAVLVHVVSSVATLQQINQQNGIIRERVFQVLKELDTDNDDVISQDEFRTILDQKEALHTFLGVGVDVIAIIKDPDIVFGGEHSLPIDEVMDEVIALRGSNFTTVKDLVQLKNQLVRELRRVNSQRRFLTTR